MVARALAKGAVCLNGHSIVEGVLQAYGVSWRKDSALEDLALKDERIVSSALREAALTTSFSQACWIGERLEIPVRGHPPLVLDFAACSLQGPLEGGREARLAFDRLTKVDIDEWEVMGDTKTHRFFYLHLSDGIVSLVYVEQMREYFERHSKSHLLDAQHKLATSVIHAIPAALGVTPRLARPDLVSDKPLRALAWGQ